jgi:ATP adenylyltransferase
VAAGPIPFGPIPGFGNCFPNDGRSLAPGLGHAGPMSDHPECFYCERDQRLHDLMIPVAELPASSVYLFREQTHPYRCIVASRHHVNELFELSAEERNLFMADVCRVAAALKRVSAAAKINYGAYSDKLPHLHVHLVPKKPDGPAWGSTFVMMPDPKVLETDAVYASRVAELAAAIGS